MLLESFKAWLRRPSSGDEPVATASLPRAQPKRDLPAAASRGSLGLDEFFGRLSSGSSLRILDLSGASQANIDFALQYGHQLYCEDFIGTMTELFGDGDDFYARQADDELASQFLSQTFASLHGPFDGALLWDSLQFLESPLLDHAIGHLHRLMEPGAPLFAFFPSDERQRWLTLNNYRIESAKTMRVIPKAFLRRSHVVNSRAIERMFSDFSNVKFFLTRDHWREVVVRR